MLSLLTGALGGGGPRNPFVADARLAPEMLLRRLTARRSNGAVVASRRPPAQQPHFARAELPEAQAIALPILSDQVPHFARAELPEARR